MYLYTYTYVIAVVYDDYKDIYENI